MSKLTDHLHDRVDLREELAEQATGMVRSVLVERFAEAMDKTETLEDALTLLAAWVSADLDKLTTDAVRRGARLAMKRKRVKRQLPDAAKPEKAANGQV